MNGVGWVDNVLICMEELYIWVRGYDVSFGWVLECGHTF